MTKRGVIGVSILWGQVTRFDGAAMAGSKEMERSGLHSALIEGVVACYERDRELGANA